MTETLINFLLFLRREGLLKRKRISPAEVIKLIRHFMESELAAEKK